MPLRLLGCLAARRHGLGRALPSIQVGRDRIHQPQYHNGIWRRCSYAHSSREGRLNEAPSEHTARVEQLQAPQAVALESSDDQVLLVQLH